MVFVRTIQESPLNFICLGFIAIDVAMYCDVVQKAQVGFNPAFDI